MLTIDAANGARRRSARHQLRALGLESRFIMGADQGDDGILALYSPVRNLLLARRSMTRGEIAVYEGHRRAWRAFLETESEYALILEDDFYVPDRARFLCAIDDCLSRPSGWDIVKFFDFRPKRVRCRLRLGETALVTYKYAASGAVAYLISRDAATRLLTRRRIFRPVDEDFSWAWEFGLRIWSTEPNLVEEISHQLGGSHLERARRHNKTRRNAVRPVWANVIQAWKLCCSVAFNSRL